MRRSRDRVAHRGGLRMWVLEKENQEEKMNLVSWCWRSFSDMFGYGQGKV